MGVAVVDERLGLPRLPVARQWTITTDSEGVRVLRRKKSNVHPWPTLNAAHLRSGRLELWGTNGRRVERFRLGGRHAGDGPGSVANAIQDRIDRPVR